MNHIKTDYSDLSVADRILKAQHIHDGLGNPIFTPAPSPTLVIFQQYIDAAEELAIADPVNTIARNEALATMDNCIALLGAWTENFCNSDLTKLQASGFDIIERNPIPPMPKPLGLQGSAPSTPGSNRVKLKWKAIYGCKLWVVQKTAYPVTDNSIWVECTMTSKSRCELDGVNAGVWAFRIIAVSSKGKSLPSDSVTIAVV